MFLKFLMGMVLHTAETQSRENRSSDTETAYAPVSITSDFDKAAKGEGWAPPFISCAQDTVGL